MERYRRISSLIEEDRRFSLEFRKILIDEQKKSAQKRLFHKTENAILTSKKVEDFTEESLSSFARYFDGGSIDFKADYLEIFDLAAAFKVEELKDECIDLIIASIYKYDPLDVYNLGNFHSCEKLKRKAFAVIQQEFPELRDEYINAPNSVNFLLTSIQQIDNFMPKEKDLKAQLTNDKLKDVTTKLQKLLAKINADKL